MKAVKFEIPALAAAYPATRVRGRKAAMLEKLTMAPRFCSTIGRRKTCVGSTVPVRFNSSTR